MENRARAGAEAGAGGISGVTASLMPHAFVAAVRDNVGVDVDFVE